MDSHAHRKKLIEQILEWNSSRLDLFELSLPNENEEFNGVMRFFYQDESRRFQTKCIRVCSSAKTSEVVETLREKFFPLDTGMQARRFGIYEHHANGVRRLTSDEHPLLVQLNWSKLDREGKFVLKLETTTNNDQFQLGNGSSKKATTNGTAHGSGSLHLPGSRIRRRWSVRREKPQDTEANNNSVVSNAATGVRPRRSPLGCAAAVSWTKERLDGHHHHNHHPHRRGTSDPETSFTCLPASGMKLHGPGSPGILDSRWNTAGHTIRSESPPDSSFTRTICNPEALMRRKRQRTLEAKLHQILQHGGPDIGGTLKIYGGQICPDVPYKTLLLSVSDTVADVIRQSLDKYGLEGADPDAYCLVMRMRSAAEVNAGLAGTEEILTDTDCPLGHLFSSAPEAGAVVTFELRHRPPHLLKRRPFSESSSTMGTPYWNVPHPPTADPFKPVSTSRTSTEHDAVFACLIEVDGSDLNVCTGTVFPLPVHKGQVCVGTALNSNTAYPHIVTLPLTLWPDVELRHLIIWRPPLPPGVTATMAATDATTKRGGWLACRPCMRPGATGNDQPQFSTVFVNNQRLRQTTENRHCVHWLAPGDILRLGHGPRVLRIWPGDGSNFCAPQRLLPKFHPRLVEPPSPTVSMLGCPEVPRHQRLYASNLSHKNRTPLDSRTLEPVSFPIPFSSDVSHSVHTPESYPSVTVSYLSPLVQRANPQPVEYFHHGRSVVRNSSGESVHSPLESTSVSSSSLCSTPVAETIVNDGPDGSFIGFRHRTHAIHSDPPGQITITPQSISNNAVPDLPDLSPGYSSTQYSDLQRPPGPQHHVLQVAQPFHPIPEAASRAQVSAITVEFNSQSNDYHGDASERTIVESHGHQPPTSEASSPSEPSKSSHSQQHSASRSGRSKSSTISDRLPCQMAFAPASVGQLLDWIIPRHLHLIGAPDDFEHSRPGSCPLGPAISVYLMLRAICRQCDRWEMIEARQTRKESLAVGIQDPQSSVEEAALSSNTLAVHQRRRRQRELLSLLISAVERLQHFETVLIDWIRPLRLLPAALSLTCSSTSTDGNDLQNPVNPAVFRGVLRSVAAWLANASQLLHLITRDVDFRKAFEEADANDANNETDSMLGNVTQSAWTLVQEQLTDVVQASFGLLSELCVTRLDCVAIPNLVCEMTRLVERETEGKASELPSLDATSPEERESPKQVTATSGVMEDSSSASLGGSSDVTLKLLTETLDSLRVAYVNPAFTVQLFARLLHRLNARLFNFLLGDPCEDGDKTHSSISSQSTPPTVRATHVSPSWGRVLHRWIHSGLCAWAMAQGLGAAAECYLQRVTQAAELMLADVTSVESLYNVAVDLVGLNSRQVRALLESFRQTTHSSDMLCDESVANSDGSSDRIPEAWIEFVVSGVKLVADRILAEEVDEGLTHGSADNESRDVKSWKPRLTEPLNLLLPLLLPEDSYPSDNPVPVTASAEEPSSSDSGISSRPSSAKGPVNHRDTHNGTTRNNRDPVDTLITVESIRQFLAPAIQSGWCRLSMRPISSRLESSGINSSRLAHDSVSDEVSSTTGTASNLISWSVYLANAAEEGSCAPHSPAASQATTVPSDTTITFSDVTRLDQPDAPSGSTCFKPDITNTFDQANQHNQSNSACLDPSSLSKSAPHTMGNSTQSTMAPTDDRSLVQNCIDRIAWCRRHRPLTVVVPKIGSSLGLSIVAARSEDGRDLGIYVRGVLPDSGASQAKLLSSTLLTDDNSGELSPPFLQPGDHLLAVNDQPVTGLAQEAAVQLVASCDNEVRLTVVRNADIGTALNAANQPEVAAARALRLSDPSEPDTDPGCIECQLRASFHISPVTLVAGDTGSTQSCEPSRMQTYPPPAGVVLRPNLPDCDPPPTPSALGPVMHLSQSHARPRNSTPNVSNRPDSQRGFRSRPLYSTESGSTVSVTFKPAFQHNRPTTSADSEELPHSPTRDPVGLRVHPLRSYTSYSMNALHHTAPNPPQWTQRMLFVSRTLGRAPPLGDLDDVALSEYSLGTGASVTESAFSPSTSALEKPNLVADCATIHPQPCHRPKGQSASFDDWISASRIRDLCEKWSEGLPFPLDKTTHDGTENGSSDHATQNACTLYRNVADYRLSTSPKCSESGNETSSKGVNATDSHHIASPHTGTSKPPATFVPTALVLPCTNPQSHRTIGYGTQDNDHWNLGATRITTPWSSRSLGDLPTLTDPQGSRPSVVDGIPSGPSSRRGRASRGLQRRHTTVTTSRFNLGPRPEPPNQMSNRSSDQVLT